MLKRLEIAGFKSFARKTVLDFASATTAIVGPNGSGKSNVAEAFRFALGEQSMKSLRGKRSEDLIFSGSHTSPRSNRASVAIVFDNSKKQFKLDFEEIVIERAVFRDGASEYSINGSKARLRDIQELLSSANIGETGHHIISQGEADRILLANPRERREMLEDALGLKAYEFKKQESERKLEKTEENIKQVESLRRELSPHLKFLAKQVEKLERADELRKDLQKAAQTYFSIEEAYIAQEKGSNAAAHAGAKERLAVAAAELDEIEKSAGRDDEGMKRMQAVRDAERELERATNERSALAREIGKAEGALEGARARSARASQDPYAKVPREDLAALRDEVEKEAARAGDSPDSLRAAIAAIHSAVLRFFERHGSAHDAYLADETQDVFALENQHKELMTKDAAFAEAVEAARQALSRVRDAARAHEEAGREGRFKVVELAQAKAREESEVVRQAGRKAELALLEESLQADRAEVLALAGSAAFSYEALSAPPMEERRAQEDRKRALERLKIRVEEAGGTGEDVKHEYQEASDREAFLARELEDLAKSAAGLRSLIAELDVELSKSFSEGLAKVNASFGEFFGLMFGGGGARLVLEEAELYDTEDEDADDAYGAGDEDSAHGKKDGKESKRSKQGIEVTVHLPKKKVQSLVQLSGGERALTSIALIFAMSQVNPPPFLILDETDAALDEANSRRYGDMIGSLAKRSQLIVITHNRETMSRAGILYGVTMGADGVSKLLSVRFDDAVAVAK